MSKYGDFNENGSEYIVKEIFTKRPLVNYGFNANFLSAINQYGNGWGAYAGFFAKYEDPQKRGRANLISGGNRYFYVNDLAEKTVFSPGYFPVRTALDSYRAHMGLGYTLLESSKNGVAVSLRGFVHPVKPCEIWTATVENKSEQVKDLRLFPCVEFDLTGYAQYCGFQAFSSCEFKENTVIAHNYSTEIPHPLYSGYLAVDRPVESFDSSKAAFVGEFRDYALPIAVERGSCGNSIGVSEQFIGAACVKAVLKPGEKFTFHYLIGLCDSTEGALREKNEIFSQGVENIFAEREKETLSIVRKAVAESGDADLDRFVNFWLKQQIQLCTMVGRGGAKGFRDQLQDAWGASAFFPEFARRKILEVFANIYRDGRCVRGFEPLDPHVYSDGPAWAGMTVSAYIAETGDVSVLDEKVPYLDGGEDTVYEHLLTTLRFCANDLGERGLVLAREGDWNDSLNFLCLEGKGESVWTSMAMYKALNDFADVISFYKKDKAAAKELYALARRLKENVNREAWDGKWYLAGISDLGEKVGSHAEKEGRIYLNTQTWAVFTGIADEERAKQCMQSVDEYLMCDYGPLTLYPPYTKLNKHIGRLTAFVPGIWENGTPYCHGGTFKIVADCMMGRSEQAYDTIGRILPSNPKNPVEKSGQEPYCLTNMYYGPDHPRKGETMFGWITGSAGWMYRAITEYVFGFRAVCDGVLLAPCLPAKLKNVRFVRVLRGVTYDVSIRRAEKQGARSVKLNGKEISGGKIGFQTKDCKIEIVI